MTSRDLLLAQVAKTFDAAFGSTPLNERVADILAQATSIGCFRDMAHLKQEAGDILSSVLQLCNECDWDPSDLVAETLSKIESRTDTDKKLERKLRVGTLGDTSDPFHVSNRRIALYASTFDPPSKFHQEQVQAILKSGFDEVVIFPTGPRPQTGDYEHATPVHRAAIASLAFRDLDRVTVDYSDLSLDRFSPSSELEERFRSQGEVWHVVHHSMVKGGAENASLIQTRWDNGAMLWKNSRFAILQDPNDPLEQDDLPAQHQLLQVPDRPASAELRARVYCGESIDDAVDSNVSAYINRHRLFIPSNRSRQVSFRVDRPKLLIVADERNAASVAVAKKYQSSAAKSPNLILVLGGDGTMLRAIREHWRLRVPFLGLNTGHLGFLMNERLPDDLNGLELITYSQPMLRVDAKRPDGAQTMGLAYTDVWLERSEGQAAWLRIDVDGETRVSKVVGDGMLIATAAGSSAYARAMGAIPVPIDTPTLTLAGSNIFQPRFWKPMILSDNSQIAISSLDHSGKRPVRGFIDGSPVGVVQELSVRRSLTASVELAFTKEFDPSARLLRTLFPPDNQ